MATITRIDGKKGVSYRIRASCGYDVTGKQKVRSMTWTPPAGMSQKQLEKELQRQAVRFEEACAAGGDGGNIKFQLFAEQWFKEYAQKKLKTRSVERLHQLEARTYAAIGHIRLDRLTARQIQQFIDNLGEDGISSARDTAAAKPGLSDLLGSLGLTQKALSEKTGVSRSVLSSICRGESTSYASAEKVSQALGKPVAALFTVTKGKSTLSPKTIKHYLSFVSGVMDYAMKFDMIPSNPCSRVTVPSITREEKDVYTLEETQRFLDSLSEAPPMYQSFFVLAIYGGFRRGELLGLEWDDIDFEHEVVSIRRTSQYSKNLGVYTDTPKTKSSERDLKLPAEVFPILRHHKAAQAAERLRLGDQWQDSNRLFVGWNGAPLHPNTPYHWLRRFCEETGQRFLGVHTFRHLNASLLIQGGVDLKTISSSLGHSQASTTLNIYAHTFSAAQARASQAVANALPLQNTKIGGVKTK